MLSKYRVKNLFFDDKNRSTLKDLSKLKRLKKWTERRKQKLSTIHDNNRPSLYRSLFINLFDENEAFEESFNDEILRPRPNLEQAVVEEPETDIRNIIRYKSGRDMNEDDTNSILNCIANSFDSIRDEHQGPRNRFPRYIYAIPTQKVIKYKCPDEVSNNFMVDIISNYDEELEIVPANLLN